MAQTLKKLPKLPEFPENEMGLQRGSILICNHPTVEEQLGVLLNHPMPIGFDGTSVRCQGLTWSIQRLIREIQDGLWKISENVVDLADPATSKRFAREIERIDIRAKKRWWIIKIGKGEREG